MIEIVNVITQYILYAMFISLPVVIFYLAGYRVLDLKSEGYSYLDYIEANKYLKVSLIVFISAAVSLITMTTLRDKLYRDEITEKIERITQDNYTLVINNNQTENNDSLVNTLKNIKSSAGNRPNASEDIYIKLQHNNDVVALRLVRDSDNKTIYWVFYDESTSGHTSVGKVITSYFNNYK